MKYNKRARLDPSQVRDRRGGGAVVGGGVGVLVLLVIGLLTGVDPSALLQQGAPPASQDAGGALEGCRTGADIDQDRDCRFVALENSIQGFWQQTMGPSYQPATFTVFTGAVNTGCGQASSQVGPFYCPADHGVYLDLGFFDVLESQLGARGGDFAEAYVIAHEYAHHVQNLAGQMSRVQTREGPDSDAVRLELQADCLAGVWAHHATTSADGREPIITEITEEDVAVGIDAAERIGDDYIQEHFTGTVTPETWTHGSSEQRRRWFTSGLDSGDPEACDTLAASSL